MEYDRMLAELFEEEDRARHMANRLAQIAETSREAAIGERASLLAFLRGPMERHFLYEEEHIFPQLVDHDLGPEVQVAIKQHEAIRERAALLAAAGPEDELGPLIIEIAKLMHHHTNFEGDYIYPELTHSEWRELMRETVRRVAEGPPSSVKATAATIGGSPPGS
jgi:hypothetical protein